MTAQAYQSGPREALEILSRLAGRTSFVTPGAGGGGKPEVGIEDLAHALGRVKDPLDAAMAMAVACQSLRESALIERLAHPRLAAELSTHWQTREMVSGHFKYRTRLVLHDAVWVVVMGTPRRRAIRAPVRLPRMRRKVYRTLMLHACSMLESAAASGAREAVNHLRGGY